MFETYKQFHLIKRSGLFDRAYYLLSYPEVRKSDINPLMHFIKTGWKEGKNPSSSFDTKDYLEKHPGLLESDTNPLIHYIKHHQTRNQCFFKMLIRTTQYLWHYYQIKQSGLFDAKYYLETYPDVRRADVDPLMHFVRIGWKEGRNPCKHFLTNYYVKHNQDVTSAKINPLLHYLKSGGFEDRDPSPFFSSSWYLNKYPNVNEMRINPLIHYLKFGQQEQRKTNNTDVKKEKAFFDMETNIQKILVNQLANRKWDSYKESKVIFNNAPLPRWHQEIPDDTSLITKAFNSPTDISNPSFYFTVFILIDEHPENLINKAITSMIKQTYTEWNLIIILRKNNILDAEILNLTRKKSNNNIRFYNLTHDQSPINTFFSLLNESKADYFFFLNPYDELHKHCLSNLAETINQSNPDLIISHIDKTQIIKDEILFNKSTTELSLPIGQLLVLKRKLVSDIEQSSLKNLACVLEQTVKRTNNLNVSQLESLYYFQRPIPGRGIFYMQKDERTWTIHKGIYPIQLTIDARLIHRKVTGTERYITQLLRGLAAVRFQHGLNINALIYQMPRVKIEGVSFVTNDHINTILSSDVFHKTFPASDNETLSEMALAPSLVFTPHDLILFNNPNYFSSEFDYFAYRNRMNLAVNLSNRVIAISNHGKKDIIASIKYPPEKIQVIHHGATEPFMFDDYQSCEKRLHLSEIPQNYFLFVGTDFPHKNLITLLKAFKILLKENPDVFLVIIGTSLHKQPQIALNYLLNSLKNNIINLGHVPDQTLQALYCNAKALIFPSLYEGFGLPVLEAMRNNTPVICSNCTSLPEVCGDAALYFDGSNEKKLAEAMISLLTNEELRQELIKKGLKNIERFQWEFTINKTIELYKKVIQDAASRTYSQSLDLKNSILKHLSIIRPTVFLVTHLRFFPPKAGNEQRVLKLLKYLNKLGYQIVVLAYPFMDETPLTNEIRKQIHQFVDYYEEVDADGYINYSNDPESFTPEHSSSNNKPFQSGWHKVENSFCPKNLIEKAEQLIALFTPEIVIAEYIWTTRIFNITPETSLKMIDLHDLFSQKHKHLGQFGIKDELAMSWQEELAFINRADIAIAIQSVEADKLRQQNPECAVITAGIDYIYEKSNNNTADHHSLLIIGSDNQINNHCLNEFLIHAWPIILAQEPNCELTIVGKVCNFVRHKPDNVTLIPYAEDLKPIYSRATVVINPVYTGTGLKIKSVEAIAHGKALIAWPEGVIGIEVRQPYPFALIQSWQELTKAVINLLQDQEQRVALENRAIEYTKNQLRDRLVYREVADRIDIHSKRSINILCLFLRYGPDNYPLSLEKLKSWYQQHENTNFSLTVWIIDNKISKTYDGIDLETGFRLVSGDNDQGEFSGFQKILDQNHETVQTFDIIHFVTSAFDNLYTGYLEYFSLAHLYPILHRPLCLGHIDAYDEPILLDGYQSQSWIRTSFFFISPQSLSSIKALNYFNHTNQIIDEAGDFIENEMIDERYIEYLRRWLSGEKIQGVAWHGSINNQDDIKRKTLAILNEHMLSIQLRSHGIGLVDYYWLATNIDTVNAAFHASIPENIEQVAFRKSEFLKANP